MPPVRVHSPVSPTHAPEIANGLSHAPQFRLTGLAFGAEYIPVAGLERDQFVDDGLQLVLPCAANCFAS